MDELGIVLAVAFLLGFVAERGGLPPLVGYLAAGFALAALDVEPISGLDTLADLGVLLLLFGIGLKLRPETLARPVVWAGATLHMAGWMLVVTPLLLALGAVGLPLVRDLTATEAALVAFALSFSSTVFAVKALQTTNEGGSLAGRVAIGWLVIQDVVAVVFLVAVGGVPSPWAVPVVAAVVLLRPAWAWLLDRSGYGELMMLLGLSLALGVGAATFEAVGIKPDLGALVVGMLLASHPKAGDLAEHLLGLKDLLLLAFFLSIGLAGLPDGPTVLVAVVLMALVPAKVAGQLVLLLRYRLRGRTAWHAGLTLGNYSEFGLIVVAVGVSQELLAPVWATVMALLVAVSFAAASPVNRQRYRLYRRFQDRLARWEQDELAPSDAVIDPGPTTVMVFGMGRIGEGAYDEFARAHPDGVLGVERSPVVVERQAASGRRVVSGDALDLEFWQRIRLHPGLRLVVLAMNDHAEVLEATRRIRADLPDVAIAAIASHPDEVRQLHDAGVTVARNLYEEAGQGLATDAANVVPGLR